MSGGNWLEVVAALTIVGGFVRAELKIRNLQNAILRKDQQIGDKKIVDNVHRLTDSELDLLLADKLRTEQPISGSVTKLPK